MSDLNESNNSKEQIDSTENQFGSEPPKTNENTGEPNEAPEFIRPEDLQASNNVSPVVPTSVPPILTETTTVKNKGKKKLAFGIVIAAAVCVGVLIFAFNFLGNKNALSSKSPEVYFQTVMKNEIEEFASNMTKSMDKYSSAEKVNELGFDMNLKFTAGSYTKQLLEYQGISIDNVAANTSFDFDNEKFRISSVLGANDSELLTVLILSEIATEAAYIKLPELSNAYLLAELTTATDFSYDTEELLPELTSMLEILNGETLKGLLVDYSTEILDCIEDVKLTKDEEVDVNGIKASYNKLTTTLNEKKLAEILISILEKASDDERIREITEFFLEASGETYYSFDDLDELIDELKLIEDSASTDDILEFSIYVDDKDQLKGLNIKPLDEDVTGTMTYLTATDGKKGGFKFTVTDAEEEVVSLISDWNESASGYTGELNLTLRTFDEYYEDYSTTTVAVEFEDVKYVDKENGIVNGTFTITSDELAGSAITFVLKGDKESISSDISINFMGMEIGTLNVTINQRDFKSIDMPSENEDIYDMETELDEYTYTLDYITFLNTISEKLGIDLNSLIYGDVGYDW